MDETQMLRELTWEAPEHRHIEKTADWYWALGIVAIAAAVASIMFHNTLFGVVILLAASTMIVFSHRKPKIIAFGVGSRGVTVGRETHPIPSIESFYLDETFPGDTQLILKRKEFFAPLTIIPVPHAYAEDINDFLATRLPEEHLEEPLSHRLLEFFGF